MRAGREEREGRSTAQSGHDQPSCPFLSPELPHTKEDLEMESTAEQTAGATFGGCENDGILFLANTAEARNGERRGAARESDVFDLPDLPHETRPRGSDNMEPRDVFQGGAAGALANHEMAKTHKPGAPVPNDGGATRSPLNLKSSAKAPEGSTCSAVTCAKPSTADDLHELNSPAVGVEIGIPYGEPLVNTGTGALGHSAASERVRKPGPQFASVAITFCTS